MALKTWGVLGIDARWLDYKAGPKAVLAMLRQEAPVYVGNPGDVLGKPELRVAAIAAPTRLEGLPDVPTLQEHGYPLVESMWRGFALRRGVPDERVDFLSDVLRQVAEHPEWEAFCTSRHVFPAYAGPEEFTAQVEAEAAETRQLLAQAGLLEDYLAPGPLPPWLVAVALAVALVMAWIAVDRLRPEAARLDLAMGAGFCWVAGVFAWEAGRFTLPADVHDVTHPAVVPGLWIALIGALGLVLMFRAGRSVADPVTDGGRAGPPLVVVGCTLALVGAVQVVGYLAAAAPFLYGVAWILGSRDWRSTTTFATAFASLSFVVFRWVLAIELPAGALLGG